MIKGFDRPTRKETLLIGFILGGVILGPAIFALSKSVLLSAKEAYTIALTMFSMFFAGGLVWLRINVSTTQHIEAMSDNKQRHQESIQTQKELDAKTKIDENRESLFALYKTLEKSMELIADNKNEDLNPESFNKAMDIHTMATISPTMAAQFAHIRGVIVKLRDKEPIKGRYIRAYENMLVYKMQLYGVLFENKYWPEDTDW